MKNLVLIAGIIFSLATLAQSAKKGKACMDNKWQDIKLNPEKPLTGKCSYSIKNIKLFYDENWMVVNSESAASFYRLYNANGNGKPIGMIYDYYITGELQGTVEGAIYIDSKNDDSTKSIGKTIGYYKSGQKSFEAIRDLKGNKLSSKWLYENGNVEGKVEYKGKVESTYWYDENGNMQAQKKVTGAIENTTWYYKNGNKSVEERRLNGWLYGNCIEYYENGKIKSKARFKMGEIVKGTYVRY